MKKITVLLSIMVFAFSCKKEKAIPQDKVEVITEAKKSIVNLIEHPYVFEKEGFTIEEFTSTEVVDAEKYLIKLTVSGNTQPLEKNHRVFVFGFDNYNPKEKENIFNFTMQKYKKENDKLIFYKEIIPKELSYKSIRFGIANTKDKDRLFVLTLKDVLF